MTPALSHCEESHSTLKFAQRAKRVVNKATVNEVAANAETNAMLKRQRKEIAVLRARLAEEGAKVDDAAIEALRRRLAEADREKNLVALALEDAETKTKEREAKIKELEAKLEELSEPHTEELDLNSTGPTGQSLSAVTPGTLQALRAFEAKVLALEKDRDAIKLKLEDDLERSEKRREELERSRLDAMGEIASLKEEIAEITTSLVDGDGASGDVQILLAQAKRARERAENELTGMKTDFFEEKSRRAVAEAEVKRLGDKVTMILEEKAEASKGTNTEASVAHLALRKQVIKQSETIALLEARTKEADQMLDEAIRVYEDEVAKNKRLVEEFKSTGCIYDESERSAISLQDSKTLEALEEQRRANDELSKKCAILEKKYAVAKAAFAKLEKDQASAKRSAEDTAGGDSLKRENKDLKRQMHKLTEVYSRLREKFNAGEEAFDKAKGAMELKYDLQALERKRQLEKKAFMAKIQDLESALAKERPATGKLGDSITSNSNKKARIAT